MKQAELYYKVKDILNYFLMDHFSGIAMWLSMAVNKQFLVDKCLVTVSCIVNE